MIRVTGILYLKFVYSNYVLTGQHAQLHVPAMDPRGAG